MVLADLRHDAPKQEQPEVERDLANVERALRKALPGGCPLPEDVLPFGQMLGQAFGRQFDRRAHSSGPMRDGSA